MIMVKKLVYKFTDVPTYNTESSPQLRQTMLLNDHIHFFLKQKKDCISEHYKTKKWDKYKKFANDYELIFTSSNNFPSVSSYQAISRSFFKLWEILHDFEDTFKFKMKSSVRAAFLAEGPGGFMEAFARYRPAPLFPQDTIFGITLLSTDKNIPNWKLPKDVMDCGNIHLLKGADNTGSLYNMENIEYFAQQIGEHSVDLVTSDGGFDFSMDFNNQEDMSMHLIICEMYMALRLQAQGGSFVLKIYDIHTMNTMRLLWILKAHYKDLYLVKPLSSRPANSEKYIVGTGFVGRLEKRMMEVMQTIISTQTIDVLHKITPAIPFIHQVTMYNVFYISRQALNIHKTLTYIHLLRLNQPHDAHFKSNLRHQLKKSLKWCYKYHMAISLNALRSYNTMYFTRPPSLAPAPI